MWSNPDVLATVLQVIYGILHDLIHRDLHRWRHRHGVRSRACPELHSAGAGTGNGPEDGRPVHLAGLGVAWGHHRYAQSCDSKAGAHRLRLAGLQIDHGLLDRTMAGPSGRCSPSGASSWPTAPIMTFYLRPRLSGKLKPGTTSAGVQASPAGARWKPPSGSADHQGRHHHRRRDRAVWRVPQVQWHPLDETTGTDAGRSEWIPCSRGSTRWPGPTTRAGR